MKYTKPTFVPPASRPTPYPTQPAGTAVAKFTLALALGLIPALAGHAQDAAPPGSTASATAPQSVAKTVVTGVAGPDTAPSADLTKITLDAVPGNVNVISSDQVEKSADNSISDIFNFQPGVYAQTAQGSDGIKISIRGSGINRGTGFFRTGVAFYFDGLPITGAGGTPYELFEPLGLNYTDVLVGGNAFDLNALDLGGAINFVSHTAYDAAPEEFHFEAGSFGYTKGQVAVSEVKGPADYYISLTASNRDGYQVHSEAQTAGVEANFGYKLSDNLDTRVYFRFRRTNNETPGSLTQADIEQDPTGANPANIQQSASRLQPGTTWVGDNTILKINGDSGLVFGVVYQNAPIQINPNPAPGSVNLLANGNFGSLAPNAALSNSTWWYTDLGLRLTYTRSDTIVDRPSTSSAEITTTFHPWGAGTKIFNNNSNINSGGSQFGTLAAKKDFNGSSDTVYRLGNDTEIANNLWLTTGAALAYITRDTNFDFVNASIVKPVGFVQHVGYTQSLPEFRGGLRYDLKPDWSVYGNITQIVEPENDWDPSGGSSISNTNTLSNGFLAPVIKAATAVTYELGTRFKEGSFQGTLSVYRSDVRNELLTVEVAPGPPPITREINGSPTLHQGIEAGLDTVLWQGDGAKDPFKARESLIFQQTFTLNSFHFKNDPLFGKNLLPGVPQQLYQAGLTYQHPTGFYVSLDAQHSSSTYEDYANTFSVNPYTVYSVTVGWDEPKGHWQTYLDFSNIFDKHYADAVSPVFNAGGVDGRQLSPGDGFGVFGGITYKF